jgi:hypothetical protein
MEMLTISGSLKYWFQWQWQLVFPHQLLMTSMTTLAAIFHRLRQLKDRKKD